MPVWQETAFRKQLNRLIGKENFMRKMKTIVAIAATVVMLGNAVAQAQNYWWEYYQMNAPNADAVVLVNTRSEGFNITGISGTKEVKDMYFQIPQQMQVGANAGTLKIENLWVTPEAFSNVDHITKRYGTGSGQVNVNNLNLLIGEKTFDEGFGSVNGGSNAPGSPTVLNDQTVGTATQVDNVTVNQNSISVNGSTAVGTVWGKAITGTASVHLTDSGFVNGTLTMAGGNVVNDGWINNLSFGSGEYSGTGEVGSLGFQASSADFMITGYDLAPMINVTGEVNLANANLVWDMSKIGNASGNTDVAAESALSSFESWVGVLLGDSNSFSFDWTDVFGSADVFGDIASFSIDWGGEAFETITDGMMSGSYVWALGAEGVSVTGSVEASVPEPATLAVIGLGIAGLGLARRRARK